MYYRTPYLSMAWRVELSYHTIIEFVCLPWSEVCSARVTSLLLLLLLLLSYRITKKLWFVEVYYHQAGERGEMFAYGAVMECCAVLIGGGQGGGDVVSYGWDQEPPLMCIPLPKVGSGLIQSSPSSAGLMPLPRPGPFGSGTDHIWELGREGWRAVGAG